jgi:hypothetical protein
MVRFDRAKDFFPCIYVYLYLRCSRLLPQCSPRKCSVFSHGTKCMLPPATAIATQILSQRVLFHCTCSPNKNRLHDCRSIRLLLHKIPCALTGRVGWRAVAIRLSAPAPDVLALVLLFFPCRHDAWPGNTAPWARSMSIQETRRGVGVCGLTPVRLVIGQH